MVPVAGVGQYHLRRLVDARAGELGARGGDHRFQVAEVARGDLDLRGDDDLISVVTAWAL